MCNLFPMSYLYVIMVFIHVICASILVMTLVIMQLVVSPALAHIPAGEEKQRAAAVIQTRWTPVADTVIVVISITALYFLVGEWRMVVGSYVLLVKATFGIITLVCANLAHFYYRGLKRRLKAEGNADRLAGVSRFSAKLERTALIFGVFTFLLGVYFNHQPY